MRSFEALGLAALLGVAGCSKRTDDAARRAWDEARQKRGAGGDQSEEGGPLGDGPGGTSPEVHGWDRIDIVLGDAMEILASGPDEEVIARLAKTWCAVEPVPEKTDHGPVHHCHPKAPVSAEGHSFTLELGALGVIGLVATDLSVAESEQLIQKARDETRQWCTRPWQTVSGNGTSPSEQFHTCPVEGGPTLAVGRVPVDESQKSWQVTIAVLGAS